MTLVIRKAREEDLPALIKLAPQESALSLEKVRILLLYMSLYRSYTPYVLFADQVLVASFSLLVMDNLAHEGSPSAMLDEVLLATFAPEPEKIRAAIIDFALQEAKTQACYKLCVANPRLLPGSQEESSLRQHGRCFVKALNAKAKPAERLSLFRSELQLREATKSDLAAILALYQQPGMDDKVLALKDAEALYQKMLANPHYQLFVAVHEKEVIGSFALLLLPSLEQQGRYLALVEDVMVSPKAQGLGVGKLMMGFSAELAEKRGAYKLALSSNIKREKAHGFYRALGFVEAGASLLVHAPLAVVEEAPGLALAKS